METMSDREKDILEYIAKITDEKGYSPSVRDIKAALAIRSTSTVHTYIQRLEEKGILTKEGGKSRTLRITDPNFGGTRTLARIPIIGRVTAGQPILATENYEGYVNFPTQETPVGSPSLFALRVVGVSMIEAGIMDGDLVIVNKQDSADNGDIVVAMINEEATVKTFYKENGHYRLQPENASLSPIIVPEVEILGKVISSVRYY